MNETKSNRNCLVSFLLLTYYLIIIIISPSLVQVFQQEPKSKPCNKVPHSSRTDGTEDNDVSSAAASAAADDPISPTTAAASIQDSRNTCEKNTKEEEA